MCLTGVGHSYIVIPGAYIFPKIVFFSTLQIFIGHQRLVLYIQIIDINCDGMKLVWFLCLKFLLRRSQASRAELASWFTLWDTITYTQ